MTRELSQPLLSNLEASQESHGHGAESRLPIISKNVNLTLCYTFLIFCGRSIWNQNVLATFAFLLKDGDPKAVGFMTAAMGLCQLAASAPTGVLADRYRRDALLKVASIVGLLAVSTTTYSILLSSSPSYDGLLLALCCWGCFWGIVQTSLSALFADSIPCGQRSVYFTKRSILINMGNVTGPTVALIMFLVLGNEWTIDDCARVMGFGQLACLPALGLLWYFNDDDCETADPSTVENDGEDDENYESSLTEAEANTISELGTDSDSQPLLSNVTQNEDETYSAAKLASMFPCCCNERRIIPIMVATADVMAGLASGMSIRYFAIFLYNNLNLKPIHVQILYMLTPLLQATLMKVAQALARQYGRCFIAMTFKWIGISFMLIMIFMAAHTSLTTPICVALVFRTAFMNSTNALTKSVLMDHVPKKERAKWSALESFNMFSWSGSAALGGILVDYHGILFNFCITAGLQFLATIPHFLLAMSVNKRPVSTTATSTNMDSTN